jgi:hypothetical protein
MQHTENEKPAYRVKTRNTENGFMYNRREKNGKRAPIKWVCLAG